VLCFAHTAGKHPQQLTRIACLLSLGGVPDVVINLDGFNETALAIENGRSGWNPAWPPGVLWAAVLTERRWKDPISAESMVELTLLRREAVAVLDRATTLQLFRSSLLGRLTATRVRAINRRRNEVVKARFRSLGKEQLEYRTSTECAGPPYTGDPASIAELTTEVWFESSYSLHVLCESRGVLYLHCLQPTLLDEGSKPASEEELAPSGPDAWKEGVERGYPRLRELGSELVERGVRFVDVSDCFAEEESTVCHDYCHLGDLGNDLLSRRITSELLSRVSIEPGREEADGAPAGGSEAPGDG